MNQALPQLGLASDGKDFYEKAYPDWWKPTNTVDIIIGFIILSLIFLIPYLYVTFLESRLISFIRNILIPFIKFRMRLEKPINLINRALKIQIFRPKENLN